MYGDSLTAGFPSYEPYGKSLSSSLAGAGISAEIVGCGLSGLTAVELARGLDSPQLQDKFGRVGPGLRRLLADQGSFDLVIIMAGTNDVAVPHVSTEEALTSLKSMHAACWAKGIPTVALSVPESVVSGTGQFPQAAQKWHAINNAIASWGKAKQGERSLTSPFFVNSARLLAFDHGARARGLWDPDNLHFTSAGSREFGSKLAPIVAPHLQGQAKLSSGTTGSLSVPAVTSAGYPTLSARSASKSNASTRSTSTSSSKSLSKDEVITNSNQRINAVVKTDRTSSTDWNCGMQYMRTVPMRAPGFSSHLQSPRVAYRPVVKVGGVF